MYIESIRWMCFMYVISYPQGNTPFQPKELYNKGFSYLVLMDKVGSQSDVTPYTCVIGVSQRLCDSRPSISWTWWWNWHKKRDLSVFTAQETNEVLHKYLHGNLSTYFQFSFTFPSRVTWVKACSWSYWNAMAKLGGNINLQRSTHIHKICWQDNY